MPALSRDSYAMIQSPRFLVSRSQPVVQSVLTPSGLVSSAFMLAFTFLSYLSNDEIGASSACVQALDPVVGKRSSLFRLFWRSVQDCANLRLMVPVHALVLPMPDTTVIVSWSLWSRCCGCVGSGWLQNSVLSDGACVS